MKNLWGILAGTIASNIPASLLILVSSIAFGLFGYLAMPKQYNPEITLPAFQIQIPYPGTDATKVRDLVLRELEEKIAEIPGVDTISSVARDDGVLSTVQFEVGEDLEQSKVKLFSKINENLDLRTGTIGMPLIKNITPDSVPILVYAFTADTLSQNEIRQQVIDISHALQGTPGASNIGVFGGEAPALRIRLNPEKLREFAISPGEIRAALLRNIPANRIGFLESHDTALSLQVDSGIRDAKMARKILVAPNIFLEDVAEVRDGFSEKTSLERFWVKGRDEKDAVFLAIAKRKGENASIVANALQERFNSSIQKFPQLHAELVRNDAHKAEREIAGLGGNLIQSILIVGAVLFLFLGFRAALVVALAIPLTLLLVFFAGYLFGQTVNRITLFALILSLGLLVDSATVVVETLLRQFHKRRVADREAIEIGMSEIGTGLLLSTLTSVIVFFPMKFITGMMGPYMGPIAFFVPAALIFSLLVAFFSTPFLAKYFFSSTERKPLFAKFFDVLSQKYAHFLEKILRSDKIQKWILRIVFTALVLVLAFPIFQIVRFQMLPKSNQLQFLVTLDAPKGSNFERTDDIATKVSETILKHPAVKSVQKYTGTPPVIDFNGLFRGFSMRNERNMATMKVNLLKVPQSTESIVSEIRASIRQHFPELGDTRIRLIEEPPGPPVRATLVAKVKSPNSDLRVQLTRAIEQRFQQTSGVVDIDTSDRPAGEKIRLAVDADKSHNNGLTNADIQDALSLAGGVQRIAEFWARGSNEHSFVETEFTHQYRDEAADFKKMFVKNASGQMLPLSPFVQQERVPENPLIFFDEGEETTFVTAEMSGRSVIYAVIDLMRSILGNPPEGFAVKHWDLFGITLSSDSRGAGNEEIHLEWGGEWKMTLENFRDLGIAMVIAFVLLLGVLILQFESFLIPPLILVTIFLAFLGILPGFAVLEFFANVPLTATGLIGFIALMGIVVNNAILFLEFVNILRGRGINKISALVGAGAERLRPIVLTSLTTILGSLTIVNDPVWSGLAWTIVFGLSLSTFLTLGIFPILYVRFVK